MVGLILAAELRGLAYNHRTPTGALVGGRADRRIVLAQAQVRDVLMEASFASSPPTRAVRAEITTAGADWPPRANTPPRGRPPSFG
jgi:hypothetical protein